MPTLEVESPIPAIDIGRRNVWGWIALVRRNPVDNDKSRFTHNLVRIHVLPLFVFLKRKIAWINESGTLRQPISFGIRFVEAMQSGILVVAEHPPVDD